MKAAASTPATSRAAGARTLAVHLLAAAATALVLLWCIGFRGGLAFRSSNKQQIFNIHPPLMLIGFIVIGGEAILAYRIPLRSTVTRDARKKAHLAMHAVALVLASVGLYAVFKYHAEAGIPDLYSLHSWLGIGTVALYAAQWLAGFLAFFFPGAAPETRRSAVPWHAVVGLVVFALAVGTAQLGFLEKMTFLQAPPARLVAKYGAEALLVNFTALVVILLGVAVVLCQDPSLKMLSSLKMPATPTPSVILSHQDRRSSIQRLQRIHLVQLCLSFAFSRCSIYSWIPDLGWGLSLFVIGLEP